MTPDAMEQRRQSAGQMITVARSQLHKMTREELAKKVNCSVADIKSLESGNPTCDFDTIVRICEVIGIPESEYIIFDPGVIF